MFAERSLLFQTIRNSNTALVVADMSGKCHKILVEAFKLKIAATIPLTQASCERSFSMLDLLKKKIRSTMSDKRLNSLMIAYCERYVVDY